MVSFCADGTSILIYYTSIRELWVQSIDLSSLRDKTPQCSATWSWDRFTTSRGFILIHHFTLRTTICQSCSQNHSSVLNVYSWFEIIICSVFNGAECLLISHLVICMIWLCDALWVWNSFVMVEMCKWWRNLSYVSISQRTRLWCQNKR